MVDGLVCEYQEQQENEHYQQERESSWQKMTSNQVIETSIKFSSLQGSQLQVNEGDASSDSLSSELIERSWVVFGHKRGGGAMPIVEK